jgi:hypothetical protein
MLRETVTQTLAEDDDRSHQCTTLSDIFEGEPTMWPLHRSKKGRGGAADTAASALSSQPSTPPSPLRDLWDRAEAVGRRIRTLANEPGGDPCSLIPEMQRILEECIRLDKCEAAKVIGAVKSAPHHMLELDALCDRLLSETAAPAAPAPPERVALGDYVEVRENWGCEGRTSFLIERNPDLEKILADPDSHAPLHMADNAQAYWKEHDAGVRKSLLAMSYSTHPDSSVRLNAICIMKAINTVGVEEALWDLMERDASEEVRRAAAEAIWEREFYPTSRDAVRRRGFYFG